MLSKLLALYTQLKQSTEALELAKAKYEEGGTLEEILTSASQATDIELDDAAVKAILNLLLRSENTLKNIGDLLGGIEFQARDLEAVLRSLQTEPLNQVLPSGNKL